MFKKIDSIENPFLRGVFMGIIVGGATQLGSVLAGGRMNLAMTLGGAVVGFGLGYVGAKRQVAEKEKAEKEKAGQ